MERTSSFSIIVINVRYWCKSQEIADLTVDCVRIDTTPYTIRLTGKERKTRIVPLAEAQVDILRNYMEENNLKDPNMMKKPLFFNGRHEKLTREGITYILKIYADMTNKQQPEIIPKKISCHSIRHSKAMHLLQAGVNLVYIRDILGHVYNPQNETFRHSRTSRLFS